MDAFKKGKEGEGEMIFKTFCFDNNKLETIKMKNK